jgi:inner membrane protein
MRTTHLLFTIFIYLLLIKSNIISFSILGLIIILIATVFPDIDAETSKLGKKIKLISQSFKHRGFFHSILFGVLASGIFYYANSGLYLEFLIGYFSHIILDLLNYKSVQLFWPFRTKTKGFIKTNSLVEKLLMLIFLIADVGLVSMII